MPIDSRRRPWRSASSRSVRNHGRESSGRSASGGMAMRPVTCTWLSLPMASSASLTASGAKPPLLASPAMFTCRSASTARPREPARRSSSWASSRRSSEWITSKISRASFTLFVCRWPTRCQAAGRPSSATFVLASCTRFSPSARNPAASAAWIRATSTVFDTPISSTSSGRRPARCESRTPMGSARRRSSIRCRTAAPSGSGCRWRPNGAAAGSRPARTGRGTSPRATQPAGRARPTLPGAGRPACAGASQDCAADRVLAWSTTLPRMPVRSDISRRQHRSGGRPGDTVPASQDDPTGAAMAPTAATQGQR